MIVRDHYFAAWAAVQGTPYEFKHGEFHLLISISECKQLNKTYQLTVKREFDLVRKFIRHAQASRSQLPD